MRSRSKKGFLFWAAATVAALSLVVLVTTWPVVSSYQSKSILAQRVEFDEAAASLFGDTDAYREIGSPQVLVIEDEEALLPGNGPDGSRLVSENYLKEKKIYPLQMRTVNFVAGVARLASGGTLVVALILVLILSARAKRRATSG